MSHLKAWLPMMLVTVIAIGVGCDDDRNVADVGVGGTTSGGEGGSGNDAGTGGGGAGGAEPWSCPADLFAADGQSCPAAAEGMACSDGADDPCQFGHSLVCRAGKWFLQEAFPAPCGASGAAGSGGAGGAPAAGVGGQ